MLVKIIFIAIMQICFYSNAIANTNFFDEYLKAKVIKDLNEIEKSNLGKYLDLDFKQIKKEIPLIYISLKDNKDFLVTGSGENLRLSGVTFTNKIIINEVMLKRIKWNNYESEFYTHEVLRALGYSDEDYQITILLYLARMQNRYNFTEKYFSDLVKNIKIKHSENQSQYFYKLSDEIIESGLSGGDINITLDRIDSYYARTEGTGTSVGGGGDDIALHFKLSLVTALIAKNSFPVDTVAKIMNIKFESQLYNLDASESTVFKRGDQIFVIIPDLHYVKQINEGKNELILDTFFKQIIPIL